MRVEVKQKLSNDTRGGLPAGIGARDAVKPSFQFQNDGYCNKEQAVEIYKECHNSGVNGHKSFYDIGAFFDERGYYEK
jgi:hypothetical protein